jgi:hypothetical protein
MVPIRRRIFMRYAGLFISIILIFSVSCTSKNVTQDSIDIARPHIKISISFNSETYPWMMGKKYPTFAVWIEDQKSAISNTVYITGKAGENDWIGADERPGAIPVWYGVSKKEKLSPGKQNLDAVTGATPGGDVFDILWQIPESFKGKKVRVFLEANVSFDYNEYYIKTDDKNSKNYSDVNGQPSLIWASEIELKDKISETTPVIIGHGHVLGSDHKLDMDLSKVTTAKEIFNYIKFSYNPGK